MAIALGIFAVILCLIIGLIVVLAGKRSSADANDAKPSVEKPRMKALLTAREVEMFKLLRSTFPSLHVLAQVSGGALLDGSTKSLRNTFDRKQIDFVVLSADLKVIALIELDDRSHKGKEGKDAARDEMFLQAGYSVLRLANVPRSEEELRKHFEKLNTPGTHVRG